MLVKLDHFLRDQGWNLKNIWNQFVVAAYCYNKYLGKLSYFTNLDFPEIRGFPLLNHHLGEIPTGGTRSRANLPRNIY